MVKYHILLPLKDNEDYELYRRQHLIVFYFFLLSNEENFEGNNFFKI